MGFPETVNVTLWVFVVVGVLSAALATVGTVADICRGRRPSRGPTIFALSMWSGLAVWSLVVALGVKAFAIPVYDHAGHAAVSFGAFIAGLFVCMFIADRLEKVWPASQIDAALRPVKAVEAEPRIEPSKALSTEVRSEPNIIIPPADTIRTAMDHAPAIRNPLSAFANTVGTNAQIVALQNAALLADATAQTADAEARGFAAIMRREDSMIEMRVRQQITPELEQNKIEEQRERLREDVHRRSIATERRSKDNWDAKRDTVRAKNGEEAERRFKKPKFELGEKRVKARMADVDVDTAAANAASRKMGADSSETGDTLIDLRDLAEAIRQRILRAAAEGQDTGWMHEHLVRIEKMLAK